MTCEGAAPFPSAPFGDGPVPDAMPGMPPSLHEGMQTGGHSMFVVHLLVAALSAWWMWGGEQAAFRTARTVPLLPFLSLLLSLFRWIFFALRPVPMRQFRRTPGYRGRGRDGPCVNCCWHMWCRCVARRRSRIVC